MSSIGIVGNGIVGNAVNEAFKHHNDVYINDIKYSESHTLQELVINCEFIFICIPTPYNTSTGEFDGKNIDDLIFKIDTLSIESTESPILVIKSAVVPRLVKKWEDNITIEIIISPEYLTERDSVRDFINQKVMILGGDRELCEELNDVYLKESLCNPECKVSYCSSEEAALIKYMENSFLAMKNIFNNQFKEFYDKHFGLRVLDENFNKMLEVFYTDERMGLFPQKYTVPGPDGDLGYGGKCLPKDISAIISEGKRQGTELSLLERVQEVNDKIRTNRDWEAIDGAFSK